MSDTSYTAPVDESAAAAAPAEPIEEAAIHPAWETAMEAVPDMIRGPLIAQIRKSDRESQQAIESARAGSVDPEWKSFFDGAREANLSPREITDTYNAALAIREDPIAFAKDLNAAINAGVKSGQFTQEQADQLKQQGAATIADAVDGEQFGSMKTADQTRMDELQARLDAQDQRQQAQFEQQSEQEVQADAQQYAVHFFNELDGQMTAAGFVGVTPETRAAVARIADSALNGDQTNTLTPQAAISHAISALKNFGQPAKGPVGPAIQMPIGGGNTSVGAVPATKFGNDRAGKDAREAAMMAEAARVFADPGM